VSHEVVVQLIGATTTRAGLTVNAKLDKRHYPTNVKATAEEMASVNFEPHEFHGEWNYTISRPSHQNMKKYKLYLLLFNSPNAILPGLTLPQSCLFRKACSISDRWPRDPGRVPLAFPAFLADLHA
jgi:hypothetical protein